MLANIFVNIPVKSIDKSFTYRIPPIFSYIGVGWRVIVPFGGRKAEGFIVSLTEKPEYAEEKLKEILYPIDDEAWFTQEMMAVARWLADFYLCSLSEMMRLFIPGKSGVRIETYYRVADMAEGASIGKGIRYHDMFCYLQKQNRTSLTELRKKFPKQTRVSEILAQMLRLGVVEKEYLAYNRVSEIYEEYLGLRSEAMPEALKKLEKRPAQKRLWDILHGGLELSVAEARKRGFSRAVIKGLTDSGLVVKRCQRLFRDSYRDKVMETGSPPALTDAQASALKQIYPFIAKRQEHIFLLHGVTGSGKTRVYIEAATEVRRQGRQVIVLVPEIVLTGQIVKAFQDFFAKDIVVIHSRLTISERNDAFARIRRLEAGVIIGSRSALFVPASNIGLIIMDEEHDASYKQDGAPRYQARTVAAAMAHIHRAVLLLGSATPSLESFHLAQQARATLLSLPLRVGNRSLPRADYVDMRQELRQGNRRILSEPLRQCIHDTIAAGQQVILMLNRRGYSTFIMCRSCGHVLGCQICGLPLVYHRDGRLLCHHCDAHEAVPSICPVCESPYIKFFGSGTEKLEQELQELVPEARVIRLDRDTTQKKFAHTMILDGFRQGKYNILLGTQMVAKGHDIPNVTLVGIISADSMLFTPDFRAAERCFSLITQTAGRAGRGGIPGRVIVQCYNPDHYAIQCALRQDYMGFYQAEIKVRQALNFPPFCRLIKLTVLDKVEAQAWAKANQIKERFLTYFLPHPHQQILGPASDIVAKLRGVFHVCLLIKSDQIQEIQRFLAQEGIQRRIDVLVDVDPMTL